MRCENNAGAFSWFAIERFASGTCRSPKHEALGEGKGKCVLEPQHKNRKRRKQSNRRREGQLTLYNCSSVGVVARKGKSSKITVRSQHMETGKNT